MTETERIVNAGRGPRFRPNRRLSAPCQYGQPWTWRVKPLALLISMYVLGVVTGTVTALATCARVGAC